MGYDGDVKEDAAAQHPNDPDSNTVSRTSLPKTVGGGHWPITDLHSYDWWDLFFSFGAYARAQAVAGQISPLIMKDIEDPAGLEYEKWVLELMREKGVRALPRDKECEGMGRLVDGRAFWEVVGRVPEEGRADRREGC